MYGTQNFGYFSGMKYFEGPKKYYTALEFRRFAIPG